MRLSGFVTVNGSKERIDWTIDGDSINEGPGLSAHEITVEGAVVVAEPEVVEYTDGYEDMTVTDLKVQCTQRELPIYGNKQQLIDRLRGWDANNDPISEVAVAPPVEEVPEEVPENEGLVADPATGGWVGEGDELDGVEGE